MDKNKEIMQEMLQTVVTHFSENPSTRRSFDTNTKRCLYNPPKNKKYSSGCAIGMYLSTEVASTLDNQGDATISGIFRSSSKKLLPEWMQNLDSNFLQCLQELHDNSDLWSKSNIKKEGKEFVKDACQDFQLDYSKIKFKKTALKHKNN